jgi:hypothetical protein
VLSNSAPNSSVLIFSACVSRDAPSSQCYKQLNSSVGSFGTDVILADTAALKTGSSTDDGTYQTFLTKLQHRRRHCDAKEGRGDRSAVMARRRASAFQ